MWEYNRIVFNYKKGSELITKLNELGSENWEVILINEKKPEKYGDDLETIILIKRKIVGNNKIIL